MDGKRGVYGGPKTDSGTIGVDLYMIDAHVL